MCLQSFIAISSPMLLLSLLSINIFRLRDIRHLEVISAHNVADHASDHLILLLIFALRVARVMISIYVMISSLKLSSTRPCWQLICSHS